MNMMFKFGLLIALLLSLTLVGCDDDDDDGSDDDDSTDDDTDDDDTLDDDTFDDDSADDDTHETDEACLFVVNDDDSYFHQNPQVTMNAAGDFAFVWSLTEYIGDDDEKDVDPDGVMARFYDADGNALGNPTVVFPTANADWARAHVASGDDRVVFAWTHYGAGDAAQGVYARLYTWDGAALDDAFLVAGEEGGEMAVFSSVAMNADGDFLIVYSIGTTSVLESRVQRFDADGDPVGDAIEITEVGLSDMDADGNFIVIWNLPGTPPEFDVYAQRYRADGTALDDSFRVNETTDLGQVGTGLAVAPDGHFVVAWHYIEVYNSQLDAYARVYEADGSARTGEFRMNDEVAGVQARPSVDLAADGRFVASWALQKTGEYAFGVRGRRYAADGATSGDEMAIFNYHSVENSGNAPTVAMSDDGTFVVAVDRYDENDEYLQIVARRFDGAGNALCPE